MEKNKKPTWIDTVVHPPVPGVVFVHSARPEKRYVVLRVDDGDIYRIDADDVRIDCDDPIKLWGTIEDWRDEIRRRTIKIVHTINK